MNVFPNPNDGMVHFKLNGVNLENMEVIVHDLLGKTVAEFPIDSFIQAFELSHLPAGLYTFSLFENGQFLEKERLLMFLKN